MLFVPADPSALLPPCSGRLTFVDYIPVILRVPTRLGAGGGTPRHWRVGKLRSVCFIPLGPLQHGCELTLAAFSAKMGRPLEQGQCPSWAQTPAL